MSKFEAGLAVDFKNLVAANYQLHSFVDLFGLVLKTPSNMVRIAFSARDHLAEFHKFHNKATKKAWPTKKIWKPPDAGKAKANFDMTMFDELNEAGIAVAV
nr:hypothetical protein CFP56_09742 [Quercus suber]